MGQNSKEESVKVNNITITTTNREEQLQLQPTVAVAVEKGIKEAITSKKTDLQNYQDSIFNRLACLEIFHA